MASKRQREVGAECSEETAGAEVTLAATVANTGDVQAGWTTKQVGERRGLLL